jgi:ABC-type polysaccharide/polyol phosphate export permease
MDATRGILMHGMWPHWAALAKVSLVSIVVCVTGAAIVQRLAPRYPKLAS